MGSDRRSQPVDMATLTKLWEERDAELDEKLGELAAQAAAGSEPATELLLTAVHVLGLARPAILKVLVDPASVDDALQRTLIALERGVASFEGRSKFRTWLHTVARNEALMVIRARARTNDHEVGDDDRVNDTAPPTGRMSSMIAGRETIRDAIESLDEPYRTTLQLRVNEQLEYAELADRLDVPVGTIRSRLAKARDLLSDALL